MAFAGGVEVEAFEDLTTLLRLLNDLLTEKTSNLDPRLKQPKFDRLLNTVVPEFSRILNKYGFTKYEQRQFFPNDFPIPEILSLQALTLLHFGVRALGLKTELEKNNYLSSLTKVTAKDLVSKILDSKYIIFLMKQVYQNAAIKERKSYIEKLGLSTELMDVVTASSQAEDVDFLDNRKKEQELDLNNQLTL